MMIKYPNSRNDTERTNYTYNDVIDEFLLSAYHKMTFGTTIINTGSISRQIGKKWNLRNCRKIREYINRYMDGIVMYMGENIIQNFGQGKKPTHQLYTILNIDIMNEFFLNEINRKHIFIPEGYIPLLEDKILYQIPNKTTII